MRQRRDRELLKTLKVEAVYPMAYETFADAVRDDPRFIDEVYNRRRLEPATVREPQSRPTVKSAA